MIRLRNCILSHLLSSAPTSSASPLSFFSLRTTRLLSTAAQPVPPTPFAVEDYLVSTCGLTRPQALKASTKLTHLRSPSKPDAVLAFLADVGVPGTAVAALVARDPGFLCANVEKTLAPNVADLTELGVSPSEIVRLIPLAPLYFRCRSISSKLQRYIPLFGSLDKLLRALKIHSFFFGSNFERVVKPNLALLRERGLSACEIAQLFLREPRLISTKQERVMEMVACAEGLGVPRGSGKFRRTLQVVAGLNKDNIAVKVENLKKTLRWSDAQVSIAVSKAPAVLAISPDKLQRVSDFLISVVGFEPMSIARWPVLLTYSLERRIRPRYHVVKILKENGLLKRNQSYYTVLQKSEKEFIEMFIRPHEAAVPCLAEDYLAACKWEVTTKI